MNKKEIIEFLNAKPGYKKKGSKVLRAHLKKQGFDTLLKDCKAALSESRVRIENTVDFVKSKILIYDIETSYAIAKTWRIGYKINLNYDNLLSVPKIICISYKWYGEDEVFNLRWDVNQDDAILLKYFVDEVLNKADCIVGHNGDRFDLPYIRTRAIANNIQMLPKYKSIDTLKIARSKYRFPTNKLNDLGQYLGLGEKIKTDYSLWDRIILHKEAEALEEMIEYCNQDVNLLEKVFNVLSFSELPQEHVGVKNDLNKHTSPYNGKKDFTLVQTSVNRAGTKKHVFYDNIDKKYFEMSHTAYKKHKEINE